MLVFPNGDEHWTEGLPLAARAVEGSQPWKAMVVGLFEVEVEVEAEPEPERVVAQEGCGRSKDSGRKVEVPVRAAGCNGRMDDTAVAVDKDRPEEGNAGRLGASMDVVPEVLVGFERPDVPLRTHWPVEEELEELPRRRPARKAPYAEAEI